MKRILVVDDDVTIRTPLSKFLRIYSYEVDEVSTGKEAVQSVTSGNYDIVLLDLILPDISGLDILKEIRKMRPRLPVIILTGFATIRSAVEATKIGASEFITKPYNLEELEGTIRKCIEVKRMDHGIPRKELDFTLSSLSNPIRRNILKLLNENKGMHLMEITRELDIDDHTKVSFHLRILKESALIEKNRTRSYMLTSEGIKAFTCLQSIESHLLS